MSKAKAVKPVLAWALVWGQNRIHPRRLYRTRLSARESQVLHGGSIIRVEIRPVERRKKK